VHLQKLIESFILTDCFCSCPVNVLTLSLCNITSIRVYVLVPQRTHSSCRRWTMQFGARCPLMVGMSPRMRTTCISIWALKRTCDMGSGIPSKPNQSHVVSKPLQTFPARQQAGPEPSPGSVKHPEQQNHTSHSAEELRPPGLSLLPVQQNHFSYSFEDLRSPGLSPLQEQPPAWVASPAQRPLQEPQPSNAPGAHRPLQAPHPNVSGGAQTPLQEPRPSNASGTHRPLQAPHPNASGGAQRPLLERHPTDAGGAQRPLHGPQPTDSGRLQRGLRINQPTNCGGAPRKPPIPDARPASLPAVQKTHRAVRSIPQSWAATPASEPGFGFAPAGGRPQSTSTEGPVPAHAALRRVTHLAAPTPHGASGAEDAIWEHTNTLGIFSGQEAEEQLAPGSESRLLAAVLSGQEAAEKVAPGIPPRLAAVPSGQEAEGQLDPPGTSRHLAAVPPHQEAGEKLTPGTSHQLAVNKWKKRPLHDVVPVPPSGRYSNQQRKTEPAASGGTCSASGMRFPSASECAQPAERCVVVPDSFPALDAYKECWQRATVEELNLRSAPVNSIVIVLVIT
jgi:hypothetical protein